jgi:uncharacterized membrane protein YjjB (DUF3815 family)
MLFKSILLAYIRHALTGGCGYLLAHGLVDQNGSQILISAALGILGVLWSTAQKLASSYELKLAQQAASVLPPPQVGAAPKP